MRIYNKGARVGYLYSLQAGENMQLSDIKVDVTTALRKDRKLVNRNKGLGSTLIKLLVEEARRRGCKRITGRVGDNDLQSTPRLLDWYEQRGFQMIQRSGAPDLLYDLL